MSALAIIVIVLGIICFLFVSIYNGLITRRVQAVNAWAQIDVQLKRRYDLIPNLVETVKGYASHEKDTLERVIKARSSAVSANTSKDLKQISQAEDFLGGALRQLLALSESYPELKANAEFAKLREEVVSTENRVSFARQHYNDSVAAFNLALEVFPANFVASFTSIKPRDFFLLGDEDKKTLAEAPKIAFT